MLEARRLHKTVAAGYITGTGRALEQSGEMRGTRKSRRKSKNAQSKCRPSGPERKCNRLRRLEGGSTFLLTITFAICSTDKEIREYSHDNTSVYRLRLEQNQWTCRPIIEVTLGNTTPVGTPVIFNYFSLPTVAMAQFVISCDTQ